MARIRSIKPEIWMSPQVMNLSHSARLLFIGLITQADDEGRGTADPRRLKAAIFGGDDDSSSSVRRWLDEISVQRLIIQYHSDSHGDLFSITGWKHHQKIDRAGRSGYPAPSESQSTQRAFVETSTSIRRGSDGSDGSLGSDGSIVSGHIEDSTKPAGTEGKPPEPADLPTLSSDFGQWLRDTWPACGPKADFGTAERSARGLVGMRRLTEDDLRRRIAGFRSWCDGGGVSGPQFVELPQNWLNPNHPNPSWAREWNAPPTKAEQRQHDHVEAAQAFLAGGAA